MTASDPRGRRGRALGVTQSAFEIIDYSLMMRLVRAGSGTTLVPASAMQGERAEGLRAIAVDDSRISWNLSAASACTAS